MSEEAIYKGPSVQNRAEGHRCYGQPSREIPLLLVVHRNAFDLFAH